MGYDNRFYKSIHSALKLREDDAYVSLYSEIAKDIHPENIRFKFKPTGLWTSDEIKAFKDDSHSDSYHNFRLNIAYKITYQNWVKHNFIMLGFDTKHQLKAFLKDFHIDKNQIALCFWNYEPIYENDIKVDDAGKYKIVFKIDKAQNTSIIAFRKYLSDYVRKYAKSSYGSVKVYDYIQLASGIHDRWFDPYKSEKIYDIKKVHKQYFESKPLYLGNILHQIQAKAEIYCKNKAKSVSNYISNNTLNKDEIDLEAFSTRFYHKYLEDKNPYRIAKFRKDWKFAAESFIKELYGKYLYTQNREKNKDIVEDYQRLADDIKSSYTFNDVNTDRLALIEKLKNELFELEDDLFVQDSNRQYYLDNWKPAPEACKPSEPIKTVEQLIEEFNTNDLLRIFYNNDVNKYIRENQKDNTIIKIAPDDNDATLVEYNFKIKELENNIKLKKKSIEFYENKDYMHKYNKIHKEFNELHNSLFGLVFSKKELTLFVNSLKLKTKICPCKFRKIILDVLLKVNILFSNNDNQYDRFKCICRRYLFDINTWKNIIKKLLENTKNSLAVIYDNSYIYKLENHLREKMLSLGDFRLQFAPRVEYFGPPD